MHHPAYGVCVYTMSGQILSPTALAAPCSCCGEQSIYPESFIHLDERMRKQPPQRKCSRARPSCSGRSSRPMAIPRFISRAGSFMAWLSKRVWYAGAGPACDRDDYANLLMGDGGPSCEVEVGSTPGHTHWKPPGRNGSHPAGWKSPAPDGDDDQSPSGGSVLTLFQALNCIGGLRKSNIRPREGK